jgi:hypothetical protein
VLVHTFRCQDYDDLKSIFAKREGLLDVFVIGRMALVRVSEESADQRRECARKVGYDIRRLFSDRPLLRVWNEMWSKIKNDIDTMLRAGSLDIDKFAKVFPKIDLTADPRVFALFASGTDRFALNIWAAIYHPPYELAGTLVHEADHRKYHLDNGTLHSDQEKLKEFHKEHLREMERRAYNTELAFLSKIRVSVDPLWEVEIVSGRPLLTYTLNKHVSTRENMLDELLKMDSTATRYEHGRQEASYTDQMQLMAMLGISFDARKIGPTYRRVEVQF